MTGRWPISIKSFNSPSGARNVIDAINAAIKAIAEHPFAAQETSFPHIRVKIVRRYQYKIFYSVGADRIDILHVRHGARRPWSPDT